jgi:hypothetical protein
MFTIIVTILLPQIYICRSYPDYEKNIIWCIINTGYGYIFTETKNNYWYSKANKNDKQIDKYIREIEKLILCWLTFLTFFYYKNNFAEQVQLNLFFSIIIMPFSHIISIILKNFVHYFLNKKNKYEFY